MGIVTLLSLQELIVGLSSLCKGSGAAAQVPHHTAQYCPAVLQRLELGFRCYDIDSDGSLDWDEVLNPPELWTRLNDLAALIGLEVGMVIELDGLSV